MQENNLLAKPFKQSFLTLIRHYPIVLLSVIVHILIRALCFVPFLIFRGNSYIFSMIIYLLFASVLRPSFAKSIENASRGLGFSLRESLYSKNIIENIGFSMSQFFSIVLWGIPLFILTSVFYYYCSGGTDFKTMAIFIRNIGEAVYGKSAGIAEGSLVIVYLFFLLLLILCIGIARQCGVRYLRMSPIYYSAVPNAEIRRCIASKRAKQLLVFLLNVLLLIPILYILFSSINQVYSQSDSILKFLPNILRKRFYFPVFGFMGAWYVLVLPARKFINAAFASDCRYHRENERSKIR